MFTLSFGDSRHTQIMPIRVTISFVTIVCKNCDLENSKKEYFLKNSLETNFKGFHTKVFDNIFSHFDVILSFGAVLFTLLGTVFSKPINSKSLDN
jgi:hypothetical protein